MEQFRQYLRDTYMRTKFPTYFKEPTLSHIAQEFINLALVHKDSDHHLTGEERKGHIMQKLHGNVSHIARKKTELKISDVGKYESRNKITKLADSILVEGAPGVGKTTFAWKMSQEWANGKLLQEWSIVLLVQLRDQGVREAKTLHDLLYHPDPAVRQSICDEIMGNYGKSVLVIIDGYDELSDSQRECSSIFQQLVTRKLLPRVTLMILSRPIATRTLPKQFSEHIDQHIEILGFTEENIGCYITSACSDDPGLTKTLNSYLSSHPFTYSLMYNPLQCAIVIDLYRIHWKCEDKKFAPRTMTELYTDLVRTLLLRYLSTHPEYSQRNWLIAEFTDLPDEVYEQFKALAQLAVRGIEERVYVFDSGVPEESLGLMHRVEEVYPGRGRSVSYSFLHLTLQEYLAAYHWSQQPAADVKNVVDKIFPLDSFIDNFRDLRHHDSNTYIHPQVVLFIAGMTKLTWCPHIHSFQYHQDGTFESLHLLHLLYETQCTELINHTLSPAVNTLGCNFINPRTAFDFFVTGYCISHSGLTWSVMASLNTKPEHFAALQKGLSSNAKPNGGRISMLSLNEPRCIPVLSQLQCYTRYLEILCIGSNESTVFKLRADLPNYSFVLRQLPSYYPQLSFLTVHMDDGVSWFWDTLFDIDWSTTSLEMLTLNNYMDEYILFNVCSLRHLNINSLPPRLVRLELQQFTITTAFTQCLALRCCALCTLIVKKCTIADDAHSDLVRYLVSPHCKLQSLEIDDLYEHFPLYRVADTIGKNRSLKEVYIHIGMSRKRSHTLLVLDLLAANVVSNNTLLKLKVTFTGKAQFFTTYEASERFNGTINLQMAQENVSELIPHVHALIHAVNKRNCTIRELTLNESFCDLQQDHCLRQNLKLNYKNTSISPFHSDIFPETVPNTSPEHDTCRVS